MSVIPMKKVRLLVHDNDVEKVLSLAQAGAVMEFQEVTEVEGLSVNSKTAKEAIQDNSIFSAVSQLITALAPFEEKIGTFAKLVNGTSIDLVENSLDKNEPSKDKLKSITNEVFSWQEKLRTVNERLRKTQEDKEAFANWEKLNIPLENLLTNNTKTYLLSRQRVATAKPSSKVTQSLSEELQSLLSEKGIIGHVEAVSEDKSALIIFAIENNEKLVAEIVKENKLEVVLLPKGEGTTSEMMQRLSKEQDVLLEEKVSLEKIAEELALKYLRELRIAHDIYKWRQARHETMKVAKATKHVVIFEGWCNELELPKFKETLGKEKVLYELEEIDPLDGEEPPVELQNRASIQPFEIITRLYGLPAHKDLDPTPFLAGFFFLFFGLSLTDVGYGIFLMAVALLVLFYFKVSATIKLFGKLLFLMGLSSALVGLLFGGYLGIESSKLPASLQAIQQFDPIGNPLPVFYLALALGVVQVMFGMMLKIYSEARNKRLLTGVLDQGPWLLLFVSLILFGASKTGYLDASSESLLTLVYLAVAIVVVASGRTGKGIFGKIQMSLLSLYNSIGYFSDILSYSRLLALGLATSALAFAVNLIAGIVSDMIPYVGAVLAVVILIAGHLFTLVVNTLGAFIHSARLQFVEFFGKFISGTGRTFRPLKREESYVTVVKDSG